MCSDSCDFHQRCGTGSRWYRNLNESVEWWWSSRDIALWETHSTRCANSTKRGQIEIHYCELTSSLLLYTITNATVTTATSEHIRKILNLEKIYQKMKNKKRIQKVPQTTTKKTMGRIASPASPASSPSSPSQPRICITTRNLHNRILHNNKKFA